MGLIFVINSILLGVGLAMDAFSVSLANGLNEPNMSKGKTCGIATTFAVFQFFMPLLGWVCVHTILDLFNNLQFIIPWIALILLGYIGGRMIYEGIKGDDEEAQNVGTSFSQLMVQGVATSIDALSVGFTIAEYKLSEALVASSIILVVTFIICITGLLLGKKVGTRIGSRATILGGVILIGIGLEIFITSFM